MEIMTDLELFTPDVVLSDGRISAHWQDKPGLMNVLEEDQMELFVRIPRTFPDLTL